MPKTTPLNALDAEVVDELIEEWSIEVGRRLRHRRRELGFTLEQTAGLAGLSRQTIHRAEFDGASVRDAARHRIATALASEVEELWTPIPTEQLRRRAKAVA